MIKGSNLIKETERYLKSVLKKKKISITESVVVAFMIAGTFFGIAQSVEAGYIGVSDSGNKVGIVHGYQAAGSPYGGENSVAINPIGDRQVDGGNVAKQAVAIGSNAQATGESSMALGYKAIAKGEDSIVVGSNSRVTDSQGITIGSNSGAAGQSVTVGTDIYALGTSAIAIGNDDLIKNIPEKADKNLFTAKLPLSTIKEIYKNLYGSEYISSEKFTEKYIGSGINKKVSEVTEEDLKEIEKDPDRADQRIFSPTYAGETGAIAIGSRTVAARYLSTSIGSLSFALAPSSTTVGYAAFVDTNATGGTAIGTKSYVFAPNSIAVGNLTESNSIGSVSYGYNSYAVSPNSVVIGADSVGGGSLKDGFSNTISSSYGELRSINIEATKRFNNGVRDIQNNDEAVEYLKNRSVDEFITEGDATVDLPNGQKSAVFKGYIVNNKAIEKIKVGGGSRNNVIAAAQYLANERNKLLYKINPYFDGEGLRRSIDETGDVRFTLGDDKIKKLQSAEGARNNVVLGNRSIANGMNTVAIGYATGVFGKNSLGLGAYTYVAPTAMNSIGMGVGAIANQANSFVAGTNAYSNAINSIAMGTGATIVGAVKAPNAGADTPELNPVKDIIAIGTGTLVGANTDSSTAFGI